jgi:hypothetical protein
MNDELFGLFKYIAKPISELRGHENDKDLDEEI